MSTQTLCLTSYLSVTMNAYIHAAYTYACICMCIHAASYPCSSRYLILCSLLVFSFKQVCMLSENSTVNVRVSTWKLKCSHWSAVAGFVWCHMHGILMLHFVHTATTARTCVCVYISVHHSLLVAATKARTCVCVHIGVHHSLLIALNYCKAFMRLCEHHAWKDYTVCIEESRWGTAYVNWACVDPMCMFNLTMNAWVFACVCMHMYELSLRAFKHY